MISSISWVPAGVADPNPKKYEMSAVEEELVRCMQQKELEEDVASGTNTKATKSKLPPVDVSALPADLRMDEYSSDEDDEGKQAAALGRLLLGQKEQLLQEGMDDDDEEEESANDDDDGESSNAMEKSKEGVDSEDEDDDLEDVPDTREFAPLDMEGLEAMGLSHIGLNTDRPDVEDDESEAEDVELTADDAVILVAKTEEVSSVLYHCPRFGAHKHCTHTLNCIRTIHHWKCTSTTKSLATSMFITIFHCPHSPSVLHMDKSAGREPATFALWARSNRGLKSGTWTF